MNYARSISVSRTRKRASAYSIAVDGCSVAPAEQGLSLCNGDDAEFLAGGLARADHLLLVRNGNAGARNCISSGDLVGLVSDDEYRPVQNV